MLPLTLFTELPRIFLLGSSNNRSNPPGSPSGYIRASHHAAQLGRIEVLLEDPDLACPDRPQMAELGIEPAPRSPVDTAVAALYDDRLAGVVKRGRLSAELIPLLRRAHKQALADRFWADPCTLLRRVGVALGRAPFDLVVESREQARQVTLGKRLVRASH